MSAKAIEVADLTHRFGGVEAVKRVSFDVPERSIVSIIGPNGAGKTTLFNVLTGLYPVQTGRVLIEGTPARKPLDLITAAEWVLVTGIAVAAGAVTAVGAEALFTAFAGGFREDGLRAAWPAMVSLAADRLGAAIAGGMIAGLTALAACYVLWSRSRGTPDVVASRGVARTFQNLRLFPTMTVLEHVRLVLEWTRPRPRDVLAEAKRILRRLDLGDVAGELACSLPYARQRHVEIARALATRPRTLLLDEPAAGMTPTEAAALVDLLRGLGKDGLTIVLIEHRMKVVMGLSERVIVLDHGAKIAEGPPKAVAADPAVIEAYLGSEKH